VITVYFSHSLHIDPKMEFILVKLHISRSQCLRVPKRRSTAARLLRLWVRIPPGA
jgi:hypothetical protein